LNDSPQHIANRIVESAKAMNCIGEYNSSTAKATLSVDGTEFCVQLFQVHTEKNNDCVIVELQRINGSSIVFHTVARSLLSASKNAKVLSTKETERHPTSSTRSRSSNRREGSNDRMKESDLFTCTLEIVDSLLKKDRVDANLLGVESLQLLTNTRSSSDAMVSYASNVVLNGGDFIDVRDTLISLLVNDEPAENEVEDKYHQKMRFCALNVLSNALDALSGKDEDNFGDKEWAGDDGLIATLFKEMKSAGSRPHEAYLAAKSLLTVFENSVRMRAVALELGISSAALQHNTIDGDDYPLLKNVSNDLLQVLGESK